MHCAYVSCILSPEKQATQGRKWIAENNEDSFIQYKMPELKACALKADGIDAESGKLEKKED